VERTIPTQDKIAAVIPLFRTAYFAYHSIKGVLIGQKAVEEQYPDPDAPEPKIVKLILKEESYNGAFNVLMTVGLILFIAAGALCHAHSGFDKIGLPVMGAGLFLAGAGGYLYRWQRGYAEIQHLC
jgi:hypothetical protein